MRRHSVAEKSMFFGIPEAPVKHFRLTPRKPLHRAEASPLLPPTPSNSLRRSPRPSPLGDSCAIKSGVHLRGKPLVVVSSASLCVIHRGVGVPENRLDVLAVIRVETDANT